MTTTGPRLAEITPANLDAALGIRVRPGQEGDRTVGALDLA
ncbi:hypothetical protein [Streptomyces sp. NPDC003877]